MNREIKFRAWDKKEKEMCYAFWLGFKGRPGTEYGKMPPEFLHCNAPAVDELDSVILEQYIGLNDSTRSEEYPDGRPIYSGDTVISEGCCRMSGKPYKWKSRVEWMDCGFGLVHHGGDMDGCTQMYCVKDAIYDLGPKNKGTIEVIGNIHLSLLENKQEGV